MKIIRQDVDSKVLVITPLLPGHKISKQTKTSIKRNNIPFTWIISEGNNNIPRNIQLGLDEFRKTNKKCPPYILPLDRDIILGRYFIDRMVFVLDIIPEDVAYTYANFEFKGEIDKKFPAIPFDINKLAFNNYISSNSLIKIRYLDEIGGFVTDEHYKRLLDWCTFLKFYQHGYIGMPTPNANFTAISTKDDISAGTVEDFKLKRERVLEDFVKPIMQKQEAQEVFDPEPLDNVLTF